MKNLLISYTAIVAFIAISLVSALFITDNTEPFVALETDKVSSQQPSDEQFGVNRSIYFCRMTRANLNEEPLKVCNELVGGYLGFDKWNPEYQLKIAKSVNLQNPVGKNPVDTTCSVIQWDVYDQVFVKYSADANNYCHYEADNNHCSFDGVRRPFDKTGLAMLKQQFDQKCAPATVTPTPTNTPTPTATATPKPTNTPTPTATATPKPTNTPTPTVTATPKPTNTPTPTVTATPKPTNTPTPTVTVTPKPTNTPTPTVTTTVTVTPTNTPTPTVTFTPTPTVTFTPTPTITVTITPSVTPTITPTVTPTVTATPVITPTPTPQVEGEKTVFGFNFSKAVAGKLHYMVGEKITFKVNFHNTGTEEVTKIYMRDVFTTDMRAEKVFLVSGNIRQDVTDLFINDQTRENGLIMPRDPYNPSQLLNLASIAGSLEQDEKLTLEFTFKAISKNDLVCNQAFTSINGRREVESSKVCVGINAIIPITD